MKVIAVAMQKGGVGKSTITRSLAVAAAGSGLVTLLLDMDPQQTTDYWGRRRPEGAEPAVRFVTERDLEATLQVARTHGCDLVVIDTPPARGSEGAAAIEHCDLVLMPCTPTIEAFEQLHRTARVARSFGKPAAVVLNLVTPNSLEQIRESRQGCEKHGLAMAPVALTRRKIHVDATPLGKTAEEMTVISPGAQETLSLWRWAESELGLGATAVQQLRRA